MFYIVTPQRAHLGVEKALIYAVSLPQKQRGQYLYPHTLKNGVEAILGAFTAHFANPPVSDRSTPVTGVF